MDKPGTFRRPDFGEALKTWTTLLTQRRLPTDCLWVFEENLCFEKDTTKPDGFHLGFQTVFTPPPPDAAVIAFDSFTEGGARLVFYRLGSCRGRSVCALLCDEWFEARDEAQGFVRRDDWLMSFRPGGSEELPEITDRQRWKHRLLRERPRHDLDFCMPLRAVHEVMAHGRVLSTYERYAMKFFHVWWRMLGHARPAPSPNPKAPESR